MVSLPFRTKVLHIVARVFPKLVFKFRRKIADGAISQHIGNLGNAVVPLFQKMPGFLQPSGFNIFRYAHAHLLLKQGQKGIGAYPAFFRQIGLGEFGGKVLLDEGQAGFHYGILRCV